MTTYAHCYLHNEALARIHFCIFTPAPLPSGVFRWRSRFHHTQGAATLAEATAQFDQWKESAGVVETTDLGSTGWTGEGVPAINLLGPPPRDHD